MNNQKIISKEKERLVKSGLLAETDELLTKNVWRKRGSKVNKGETPITKLIIHIYAPHNVYDEDGKCIKVCKTIPVKANFYKTSQVSPIKKGGHRCA
ncbi:MAG: hypothetical protein IJD68_02250 [Ruminococcus sp.]|nr:hypothetical protein [Ruminococcus sp.]